MKPVESSWETLAEVNCCVGQYRDTWYMLWDGEKLEKHRGLLRKNSRNCEQTCLYPWVYKWPWGRHEPRDMNCTSPTSSLLSIVSSHIFLALHVLPAWILKKDQMLGSKILTNNMLFNFRYPTLLFSLSRPLLPLMYFIGSKAHLLSFHKCWNDSTADRVLALYLVWFWLPHRFHSAPLYMIPQCRIRSKPLDSAGMAHKQKQNMSP